MRHKIEKVAHLLLNTAKTLINDAVRSDILRHAYGMAYVSLLSLIPSLAAIFAVLSLFNPMLSSESNFVNHIRQFVIEHLAQASGEQAISYIESFIANLDIKKIGITGFAGTLVTLILLLKHIEVALNKIFQVHKPRSLITRFVHFWTFLTLGSFSLALFVSTLSSYASAGEFGGATSIFSDYANKAILVLLFSLIYKLVPNCYVNTLSAFSGGLLATFILTLASELLQKYVDLFSNYKAIYGAALAAIPIFLLWLYVIWVIILLGALFTWRMQHRKDLLKEESESKRVPKSPYEQAKIKVNLPILILEVCYDAFEEGNGEGISPATLANKLDIPIFWLDQFVDLLVERNLLVIDQVDPQSPRLLPKRPRSSISQESVDELLSDPSYTMARRSEQLRKKSSF